MEVGVRIESENPFTETKHTASAYLTFVSLDESGNLQRFQILFLRQIEIRRYKEEKQNVGKKKN